MPKYSFTCVSAMLTLTASAHAEVCGPGACWTGEYHSDRVTKPSPPSGGPDNRGSSSGSSGGGSGGSSGGGLVGGLLKWLFAPPPPETPEQRAARLKREEEQRAEWERKRAEEARLIAEGQRLQAQHDGFSGFTDTHADRESQPQRYLRGLYVPVARTGRASRPPADDVALRADQSVIGARLKVLASLKSKPNEVWCKINFPPALHQAGSAGNEVWARYVANVSREWDARCGGTAAPSSAAAPAPSTAGQAPPVQAGTAREGTARRELDATAGHGAAAVGSGDETSAFGTRQILDSAGSGAEPPPAVVVPAVSTPTLVEDAVPPALQKSEQWQQLEQQQRTLQKNADAVADHLRALADERKALTSPRKRARLDGEIKKLEQERANLIPQINLIKTTKAAVLKSFKVSFDEEDKGPSPTKPSPPSQPSQTHSPSSPSTTSPPSTAAAPEPPAAPRTP
jgi:hypothetical protein